MSKTYTLTPECYLYSSININSSDADRDNPPAKLAVDKDIVMFASDNPNALKTGDKLIVHGTEIDESHWQKLAKSFYFTVQTVIYGAGWSSGKAYCFIGVNHEGDSVLFMPKSRDSNTINTFKLPLKFDWSPYGVQAPNSALEKKENEIEELKKQLEGKEHKLEEKENEIEELKKQIEEKDHKIEEKEVEIKKLEQQLSDLKQQQLQEEENKLLGKKGKMEKDSEEQLTDLGKQGPQYVESEFQLVNQKLDQLLSLLQNDNANWHCQPLLQPPALVFESKRCPWPSEMFVMSSQDLSTPCQLRVSIQNLRVFALCDDTVGKRVPEEQVCVHTADKRFHNKGWWFIKAIEHKTTTMIAFYDGDFDEVSIMGNYVNIPFRPEAAFSSSTQFFVGLIHGVGLRFMFLY